MFPSFKLTLLAALLMPAVTNASPHNAARFNPHSDISLRAEGQVNLHRRFTNARMTYYNVQTGNEVSCGQRYTNDAAIIALSRQQMNPSFCGKKVRIQANGQTRIATLVDTCEECPYGAIDLSPSLFAVFQDPNLGTVYGTWNFIGEGEDVPPPPRPTYKPPPPKPKPTPPPPPPPKPTTSKASTTSHSTSTSGWTSSTTSKPTGTAFVANLQDPAKTASANTTTTDFNVGPAAGFAQPVGFIDVADGNMGNLAGINGAVVSIAAMFAASRNTA